MAEVDRRKAALIAELEISRGEIRSAARACEESVNVVSQLRRSIRGHLGLWLPGAALGGWALSKLLRMRLSHPKQHTREKAGKAPASGAASMVAALFKVAFDLARPSLLEAATSWIAKADFNFGKKQAPGESPPAQRDPARDSGHAHNGATSNRSYPPSRA